MKTPEAILQQLPYEAPFRFVDAIESIDADSVRGRYFLDPASGFYRGHFRGYPVTPGVILTEIAAQIGLVCLGLFLEEGDLPAALPFVLCASDMEFLRPVYPGETVWVESRKVYYRFGKLKCTVIVKNEKGEPVCEGILAGIQIKRDHE